MALFDLGSKLSQMKVSQYQQQQQLQPHACALNHCDLVLFSDALTPANPARRHPLFLHQATRALASEITSRGATLHDLLGREVELRADRTDAIARPLDVDQIEVGVQKGIDMITEEVQRVSSQMDNLGADEANLGSKIEKKTMDLERNNKRLRALESVRPAFMDEYEKLEADLQVQYEVSVRLCWSSSTTAVARRPSFATQQQHPQLLTGRVVV